MIILFALFAAHAIDPVPSTHRIQPDPGRRTVVPHAPTFCTPGFEPLPERDATASRLTRLFGIDGYTATTRRFRPLDELTDDGGKVARLACTFPDDPDAQAWVAAYEQMLVNALDPTPDDLAALWGYVLTRTGAAIEQEAQQALAACPYELLDDAPADARDAQRARRRLLCEEGNDLEQHWWGQAWFADRGDELDAVDRTALVSRFVGDGAQKIGLDPKRFTAASVALWIFIREDAAALDRDALFTQIEPLQRTPWMDFNLRLKWLDLNVDVQQTTAGMAAFAAREPRVQALFDGATAAGARWRADMAAHADAFALARRIEAAWLKTPGATMQGCREPLLKAVHARAAELGPTSVADMHALVHDPLADWLLTARRRCEADVGDRWTAIGMGPLWLDATVVRGPRTAAVLGAQRAAAEQKQDAPFRPSELHPWSTFRIDHGVIGRIDPALDWGYTFPHSLYRRTYEVLAGVSPKGDKLQLTFDQQSWDQVILDCVDTDKIDQIRPDGKVIYRRRCTRAGVEHRQHQEPPIEIDAGAGGGLKPGMFIELIVYTNPREAKTEGAFVAEAYASAKRERLVFFAGIPVP